MVATSVVAMLACGAGGCARRPIADPTGVDPKLRLSTYLEEGSLLALAVSTRAAQVRPTKPYLPLEIAIVNKGLEALTVTPESLTLRTADGRRFAAVGRDELSREYGSTDIDHRFTEAAASIAQRFATHARIGSNFSPGFDDPVPRERVFLPRFSYLVDFVYFPRPPADAANQPLELVLETPELDEPLFVRFANPAARQRGTP